MLYRSDFEISKRIANEFEFSSGLRCKLCEADGYDFTVLEHLNLPIMFIINRSPELFDFLTETEKDSKDLRAYKRRHLDNLMYAVRSAGDKAFAQFVDEKLSDLGAKRIVPLDENHFDWSLIALKE